MRVYGLGETKGERVAARAVEQARLLLDQQRRQQAREAWHEIPVQVARGGVNVGVVGRVGEGAVGVGAERRLVAAHELGPEEAREVDARQARDGRLAREGAREIEQIEATVGAAVALEVGRRVHDLALLGHEARHMRPEVEDLAGALHHVSHARRLVVYRVAAVVGAVHERRVVERQERDGDQAEAAVVDERHQRQAQVANGAVKVRLQSLELVTGDGRRRRVVVAVQTLGVERKLEQNVLRNVLAAARHATDVRRLDGLLRVGQIHLRDDDLAVRRGRVQKVLRQPDQRQVGRNLFVDRRVGREGRDLLHDRLEALIPIRVIFVLIEILVIIVVGINIQVFLVVIIIIHACTVVGCIFRHELC